MTRWTYQHIPRHVRCADPRCQHLAFLEATRQAKVDDLQHCIIAFVCEQEVLWLQVTVYDVVGVAMVHGEKHCLDLHSSTRGDGVGGCQWDDAADDAFPHATYQHSRRLFVELLLLLYTLEQFTPTAQLHDLPVNEHPTRARV